MTSPYSSKAARALPYGVGIIAEARVTGDDIDDIVLDVKDFTLAIDEEWAPRCVLEVVASLTDGLNTANIDPRYPRTLELTVGYRYPDETEDLHLIASLGITERDIDQPGGTITVHAAGAEEFLDDVNSPIATGTTTLAAPTVTAAVTALIGTAPTTTLSAVVPAQFLNLSAQLVLTGIEDRLELARTIADSVDAVLYGDQFGGWVLEAAKTVAGKSAAILKTGAGGTIRKYKARLTREGFATTVYLTADPYTNDSKYSVATDAGDFRPRHVVEKRSLPAGYFQTEPWTTDPAAAAMLTRTRSRGRALEFETVAPFWLRIGDTITVTTDQPEERALIKALKFTGDGVAQIRTRQPE